MMLIVGNLFDIWDPVFLADKRREYCVHCWLSDVFTNTPLLFILHILALIQCSITLGCGTNMTVLFYKHFDASGRSSE